MKSIFRTAHTVKMLGNIRRQDLRHQIDMKKRQDVKLIGVGNFEVPRKEK
jgi:hypothetical protein